MKYLLLILLLTACASKTTITQTYDCAIYGPHGTYASMKVEASNGDDAEKTAAEVKKNLISQGLVPEYVASECYKELREYPRGK